MAQATQAGATAHAAKDGQQTPRDLFAHLAKSERQKTQEDSSSKSEPRRKPSEDEMDHLMQQLEVLFKPAMPDEFKPIKPPAAAAVQNVDPGYGLFAYNR